MPKISVIVPTRNRLAFLQRAVDSVFRQTERDWELLIIDDASDDGTWDWLRTMPDPRVRVIRLSIHAERSHARNIGLTEARGEFSLFLDDDDYLRPHALAVLSSALLERDEAIAAIGARLDVYHSTYVRYPHPKKRKALVIWPELLAGWMPAQGQYMVRTSVMRRLGGWSERFDRAEDVDLWFRLGVLGPVVFVPWVVMHATRAHPDKTPLSETQRATERRLVAELSRAFVSQLEGPERDLGERILYGRTLWEEALQAYYEGHHVRSVRAFMHLYRCVPSLFWSPILGRPLRLQLARAVAGLVFGKRGRRIVKSLAVKLRRA